MTIRTDRTAVYTIICDRCQSEQERIESSNPRGWPPELQVYGPRGEDYTGPRVWEGQLCADCTDQLVRFLDCAPPPAGSLK